MSILIMLRFIRQERALMKKPIRVICLIANAAPYGSNSALLNLLEMLISKGVKPLVVMSSSGGICEILKERNIPHLQVKYYYSIYPRLKSLKDFILFVPILCRTILYNFIAIKKLTQIGRKYKADLIHTNIGPLHIGYHVAKRLHIPHIWHIREYQELYLGWRPLFSRKGFTKKLSSKNSHPISITNGLYKHYSMKENARVIYDGVLKTSQTQFISQKEKYFLFVGRLEKAKGIIELIDAFIEFAKQNNDYKLLVLGDGTEKFKSYLRVAIHNAKMIDNILFLGFRNDVPNLMAHATALVVSSSFEGFGFTTVEAMFNGCLVIGKNAGGTKEILEENKLGILYNENHELITIFHELAKSGVEKYLPTITKAQEISGKLFSCENNSDKVLKFYRTVISNNVTFSG